MDDASRAEQPISDELVEVEQSDADTNGRTPNKSGPKGRRHTVWAHFVINGQLSKCKACGKQLKNGNSSNLMKHLQSVHPDISTEVEHKENERKSSQISKPICTTPKLKTYFERDTKYVSGSKKQVTIDNAMGLLAALPTVSLNSLLTEEFQNLLHLLDPKYDIPQSRTKMYSLIRQLHNDMKMKVARLIEAAQSVAVSVDIWTQKGMVRSYIAITAHFFSHVSQQVEHIVLAIRPIDGHHTAANVLAVYRYILQEWNISEEKISRQITDNGSNLVAGFRQAIMLALDVAEVEAQMTDESSHAIPPGFNLEIEQEEEDLEGEYVAREKEFNLKFSKRMSCVAHDLALCLHCAVDTEISVNRAVSELLSLHRKFHKSVLATRNLIELCGKTVKMPPTTRWNSLYITLERFFDILPSVNAVCLEQRWTPLSAHIDQLEELRDLLKPFYEETNFLQAEQYTTLSAVYPTLKNLITIVTQGEDLKSVRKALLAQLRKRFERVLDVSSDHFNPTYVMATLLDPNVAWLLEEKPLETARKSLLATIERTNSSRESESEGVASEAVAVTTQSSNRYGLFAVQMAVKKRRIEEDQRKNQLSTEASQLVAYMSEVQTPPAADVDAYQFWLLNRNKYPSLARVAFDLLPIPATSAPVERVFSQAGICTVGHKNRTGPKLLEMKVMLNKNKTAISL